MIKKIICIVLLIFVISYFSKAKAAPQQNTQTQGANNGNQQTQTTTQGNTQTQGTSNGNQQTQNTSALDSLKQLNVKMTVDTFLGYGYYQLQVLPIHAYQWQPIAEIPFEYWDYAKEVFKQNNESFHKMWNKVKSVSNKTCKTGIYKSEFDDIRDALEQRSNR